jgi:MoaA/NifB/PqqE/SkfB family radical SAM enzyme
MSLMPPLSGTPSNFPLMDEGVSDIVRMPAVSSRRMMGLSLESFFDSEPRLKGRYIRAKEIRRVARHSNNYDLTSRCNLFCEGCFYFEGDDYKRAKEQADLSKWRDFFRSQAEMGVTFANIAGAEPALEQRRIAAAHEFLPRGSVFTNGTIKIDRSFNYTILISVWGDEKTTAEFRGGGVFWKAIKAYQGDPRARILFTVHARNVHQIPAVARIIAEHGIRFSFNYFSPTDSYLEKTANEKPNDDKFFRLSSRDDNFILSPEALKRIRAAIDEAIDRYPEAIIHSHAFNRVITEPEGIYDIDPASGIATNCNARNFRWHQTYRVDLKPSDAKCCTPNVDCKQCRLNAQALGSLMFRQERFAANIAAFRDWLDMCEQWGRGHLLDSDPTWRIGTEIRETRVADRERRVAVPA